MCCPFQELHSENSPYLSLFFLCLLYHGSECLSSISLSIFGLRETLPAPNLNHLSCTDRKSTRLNSSHSQISYAVFCLKKKTRLNRLAYRRTIFFQRSGSQLRLISY